MASLPWRLVKAVLLALALGALALAIATGNTPCVFSWLTGWPCPSCGSGRSVRALAQGDLATAWSVNPLGVPATLLVATTAIAAIVLTARTGSPASLGTGRRGRLLAKAVALMLGLEVLLWIVRFMGMLGGPVPV